MTPYQLLFADQSLDQVFVETDFPAGSPVEVARARAWEGNPQDTAAALGDKAPEPWASLVLALARMNAKQDAIDPLRGIAEDAFQDARPRLWAWTALRSLGHKPGPIFAEEVLGCVVEVPVDNGLDVLGVYTDGSVRYMSHADHLIAREADGQPDAECSALLSEAYDLLKVPAAERDPEAEPPKPKEVRLTALSPQGVHQVTVPWSEVEPGGPYAGVFGAAIKVLDKITKA